MKLVILEDHAESAIHYITQLKVEGVTVDKLLLFDNNQKEVQLALEFKRKYKDLGIRVEHVDILNFLAVAQDLYDNKENIFLFDVDLEGDRTPLPDKIQIAFAKQKIFIDKDEAQKRFFFYSTFPTGEQYAMLQRYFNERVIDCNKKIMKIEGIEPCLESTILSFKKNDKFCSLFNLKHD